MKKHKAIYTSESITYWPSFTAGVGMISFCGVGLLIMASCFILILRDGNVAKETVVGLIIGSCLCVAVYVWLLMLAVRSMFCCITVTESGFSIVNKAHHRQTNILWEQVKSVSFFQESYRGRKQYRVYLKEADPGTHIAIPISMVNEEKLRAMIPAQLLTNKAYWV